MNGANGEGPSEEGLTLGSWGKQILNLICGLEPLLAGPAGRNVHCRRPEEKSPKGPHKRGAVLSLLDVTAGTAAGTELIPRVRAEQRKADFHPGETTQ